MVQPLPDAPSAVDDQSKSSANKGGAAMELDCLELLEEEIVDALKRCTVTKLKKIPALRGCSVLLDNFSVTGEARTSQKSCHFKASVSFSWDVLDALGGFLGCHGSGEIQELRSEVPVTPMVIIKTRPGGASQAREAGSWMKEEGARLISECLDLEQLSAAVLSSWDDLAEEVAESQADSGPALQECTLGWAEEWLTQKLTGLKVTLFGGLASAAFPSVTLSGDLSITADHSPPTASFALKAEIKWLVTSSTGVAEGLLWVDDFTAEKGAAGAVMTAEPAGKKITSGQLLVAFRQNGISAVRSVLSQFVVELRQRAEGPQSA